jgi:tRNA nucleotidyltransferase (CCA-adding enzyme)
MVLCFNKKEINMTHFKHMFKVLSHKTFMVGGAIRNELMGKKAHDFDFVIADTSEEEFMKVFPEAKKVGNSFPVFILRDKFGEDHEVALCRTERSFGAAYTEFEFIAGVSIEEDLARRDLTVNAIARNIESGKLVDPFNGIGDISAKIIRTHNSQSFDDDPIRILRAIRFASQFDFEIDNHTMKLMKKAATTLVKGSPSLAYSPFTPDFEFIPLAEVPTDRVHKELVKMYEESPKPSKFFRLLDEIGALGFHFQELVDAKGILAGRPEHHPEGSVFNHLMNSIDAAKRKGFSFDVAIAGLTHDLGKTVSEISDPQKHIGHENKVEVLDDFFKKHRFTSDTMKLARLVFKQHMRMHKLEEMRDIKKIKFVRTIPKLMRKEFLDACSTDAELSQEQVDLFRKISFAIDTAVVDVPKEVLAQGKEVVSNFVNQAILQRLRTM